MIFSKFKWIGNTVLELETPQSAYIYYRNWRMNLLTGRSEVFPLNRFLKRLSEIQLQEEVSIPTVFHFYYEFGPILKGMDSAVPEDAPVAIEIEYEKKTIKNKPKSKLSTLPLKSVERPTWSEYTVAFNRIQEHLLNGDCYQVNLTYPFHFETADQLDPRDICDFFFSQDNLSAYAHATFLGDDMILSNSPECLFQYRNKKIFTMPIKGTVKLGNESWEKQWDEMKRDVKEEGELNMITDLLRNDLNRLEGPRAKVLKKRTPLFAPGLLHQCSILSVQLENKLSLLKTLECLFPGGSVTGAPKKRVMEIIEDVERYSRGIYCGSTLLCMGSNKVANINIRTFSLSVSERLWRYGAGGGITLLSRACPEYLEMEAKVVSFLTLLRAPGYSPLKKQ